VSDVRALIARRAFELGDGAYLERAEARVHRLEEWLRGWSAYLAFGAARREGRFVKRVNALENENRARSDATLRQALRAAARRMQRDGFTDVHLADSFAIVREAARRVLGMRHHDMQLRVGRALLSGRIAEMATGEGKTLAGTLAVCTAAVTGAAVHVVTVNDYLADRDAEDNGPLYAFFELSVGVIKQGMSIEERRRRYAADVVYVSNKELTFDYLKDRVTLGGVLHTQLQLRRLARSRGGPQPILRGLHVAIVDEADSVLIDEARTPLIISETLPDDLDPAVYRQAVDLVGKLSPGRDYVAGRHRDIWLTAAGESAVAMRVAEFGGVWTSPLWQKELVNKALLAVHLFQRDQHYIITENKVQIVDEFTGRVMPDRTWERGLHQMIEAKENCEITGQRKTLSQITYQRFFGRYLLLAGMTGTAREVARELKAVYDLPVTRIPTHQPSRRERWPDHVLPTAIGRWEHVAQRACEVAACGRAVLVGTRSVEASEMLGQRLAARGVQHVVLNARQDEAEAEAVAMAGQSGRITVATNMAGRGTDIKLAPEVEAKGGLHVILTEFHESSRVDRQLFGRSARQGNPGSVEAIVSLDDELFRRYVPMLTRAASRFWLGQSRLQRGGFRCLVKLAQWKAERHHRRLRVDTLERDRKWWKSLGFVGADKK